MSDDRPTIGIPLLDSQQQTMAIGMLVTTLNLTLKLAAAHLDPSQAQKLFGFREEVLDGIIGAEITEGPAVEKMPEDQAVRRFVHDLVAAVWPVPD